MPDEGHVRASDKRIKWDARTDKRICRKRICRKRVRRKRGRRKRVRDVSASASNAEPVGDADTAERYQSVPRSSLSYPMLLCCGERGVAAASADSPVFADVTLPGLGQVKALHLQTFDLPGNDLSRLLTDVRLGNWRAHDLWPAVLTFTVFPACARHRRRTNIEKDGLRDFAECSRTRSSRR